jgi:hypothetical protein
MMKRVQILLVVLLGACGGGGSWVDAPTQCQQLWALVNFASLGEPEANQPKGDDLAKVLEAAQREEAARGVPAEELAKDRQGLDQAIATVLRQACSSAGKSFTGEWECSAQQQRAKCT